MNGAAYLALADRRARLVDARAAQYKEADFKKHLAALKPERTR